MDILNLEKINAISPIVVTFGGSDYDLECVCVETGLAKINVMGLTQCCEWGDFSTIKDWDCNEYDPDSFHLDFEE